MTCADDAVRALALLLLTQIPLTVVVTNNYSYMINIICGVVVGWFFIHLLDKWFVRRT